MGHRARPRSRQPAHPRQYQARWLDIYRSKLSGGQGGDITHPPATAPTSHCGGGTGDVLPGGWALPGPRAVLDATADQIDNPHHDHPAWDWAIPQGTPVYAVRGGTVVGYSDNPHNCNGQASCDACGLGLTIADDQGVQWTYCHGSAHHVHRGDIVTAGQQILDSGNTGNSTGPHLHLAIRAAGIARCPPTTCRIAIPKQPRFGPDDAPIGGLHVLNGYAPWAEISRCRELSLLPVTR